MRGKYSEGYCNKEIAQRMINITSNVARIVDKLVEKKWVNRFADKGDRRRVKISITETVNTLLDEIEKKPFPK